MASFLHVLRDFGLLVARIGLGLILIAHGWRRWRQLGVDNQVIYLRQFGTPYPEVATYGAIVIELVGGLFLIAGALTPLVALAVLVQQVLTIAYTNWYREWPLLKVDGSYNGGYEYNVVLGLLALIFVVHGGGRVSIDNLFRRGRDDDADLEDDVPSRA